MVGMDKKDCIILNLLQQDCRMSLTNIAAEVGLSVDSTKKRISKMLRNKIFYPRIQLRLRHMGFDNIVEVKIKLHNYSASDLDGFINFLKENPFVSEIFSVSGEWDLSIVIVSKNAKHMLRIGNEIRGKYREIIKDWSETVTSRVYKFETYDVVKLIAMSDSNDYKGV